MGVSKSNKQRNKKKKEKKNRKRKEKKTGVARDYGEINDPIEDL